MIAGRKAQVYVSGVATAFVGEATTNVAADNKTYQVTDTVKQVFDRSNTVRVHVLGTNGTATTGTTTTTVKLTTHGLVNGDLIVNTTRGNAARIITYVDVDTFTVTAITSQASGDTLQRWPSAATTLYALNRLKGQVVFASATSRTVRISGDYLPMSVAAEAKGYSYSLKANNADNTVFGAVWVSRAQILKDISGKLEAFYLNSYFVDALAAGVPVVIELWTNSALSSDIKIWGLIASEEISAAVDGLVEEGVDFEGAPDIDGRSVSIG